MVLYLPVHTQCLLRNQQLGGVIKHVTRYYIFFATPTPTILSLPTVTWIEYSKRHIKSLYSSFIVSGKETGTCAYIYLVTYYSYALIVHCSYSFQFLAYSFCSSLREAWEGGVKR